MTRMPDEIKKGAYLFTPEEVKEILQQKWTIHSQEKLYRSALALIQQLEADNAKLRAQRDAACLKNRCIESTHMLCEDGSVQRDPIAGALRLRGV